MRTVDWEGTITSRVELDRFVSYVGGYDLVFCEIERYLIFLISFGPVDPCDWPDSKVDAVVGEWLSGRFTGHVGGTERWGCRAASLMGSALQCHVAAVNISSEELYDLGEECLKGNVEAMQCACMVSSDGSRSAKRVLEGLGTEVFATIFERMILERNMLKYVVGVLCTAFRVGFLEELVDAVPTSSAEHLCGMVVDGLSDGLSDGERLLTLLFLSNNRRIVSVCREILWSREWERTVCSWVDNKKWSLCAAMFRFDFCAEEDGMIRDSLLLFPEEAVSSWLKSWCDSLTSSSSPTDQYALASLILYGTGRRIVHWGSLNEAHHPMQKERVAGDPEGLVNAYIVCRVAYATKFSGSWIQSSAGYEGLRLMTGTSMYTRLVGALMYLNWILSFRVTCSAIELDGEEVGCILHRVIWMSAEDCTWRDVMIIRVSVALVHCGVNIEENVVLGLWRLYCGLAQRVMLGELGLAKVGICGMIVVLQRCGTVLTSLGLEWSEVNSICVMAMQHPYHSIWIVGRALEMSRPGSGRRVEIGWDGASGVSS